MGEHAPNSISATIASQAHER